MTTIPLHRTMTRAAYLPSLCARRVGRDRALCVPVAIAYSTVDEALRAAVPEFGGAIDEHITDNDEELLPHILFGDLTRFVLQ
jgi:hypothetical protein